MKHERWIFHQLSSKKKAGNPFVTILIPIFRVLYVNLQTFPVKTYKIEINHKLYRTRIFFQYISYKNFIFPNNSSRRGIRSNRKTTGKLWKRNKLPKKKKNLRSNVGEREFWSNIHERSLKFIKSREPAICIKFAPCFAIPRTITLQFSPRFRRSFQWWSPLSIIPRNCSFQSSFPSFE